MRQILLLLLGTWMALCGGSLYAFSRPWNECFGVRVGSWELSVADTTDPHGFPRPCAGISWLSLGVSMAFPLLGRFEVQMMSRCQLSAQRLDVVYAAGQAGVGLGIVPGTLYDLRGPMGACLYGALVSLVGHLGMVLQLRREHCGGAAAMAFWYFLVQQVPAVGVGGGGCFCLRARWRSSKRGSSRTSAWRPRRGRAW